MSLLEKGVLVRGKDTLALKYSLHHPRVVLPGIDIIDLARGDNTKVDSGSLRSSCGVSAIPGFSSNDGSS